MFNTLNSFFIGTLFRGIYDNFEIIIMYTQTKRNILLAQDTNKSAGAQH